MSARSVRSWLGVCDEFAIAHEIPRDLFELLFCFRAVDPGGGPSSERRPIPPPEPSFAGDFDELERALLDDDALARVAAVLREDVDPEQAELFARRIAAVDRSLAALGDACGRLLRVGLRQRLRGILAAPRPRAVRVRALADFYHSQLGWHRSRASAGPSLAEHVARLEWRAVAAGIEHARIAGPSRTGPLHVNLLRVAPERVRVEVHDCKASLAGGHGFVELCRSLGATAAVSGGFFLYSEPEIEAPSARFDPVGLLLDEGRVVSAPVFRRGTLTIAQSGRVAIDRLGLEAATLVIETASGELELDGQQAWNRSRGRIGPGPVSAAIVGERVVAVGRSLAVPLNGFVVPLLPGPAPAPGDRVRYAPIVGPRGEPLRAAVAGGPMLIEHGRATLELQREEFCASAPPVTFSQDETGDRNLLPRLAVGIDCDDRLVFAAVDGRDLDHALGMTLRQVGELLLELECHAATNLDGGASKRMVVAGEVVDRSSVDSAAGMRPVQTGVFLFANAGS